MTTATTIAPPSATTATPSGIPKSPLPRNSWFWWRLLLPSMRSRMPRESEAASVKKRSGNFLVRLPVRNTVATIGARPSIIVSSIMTLETLLNQSFEMITITPAAAPKINMAPRPQLIELGVFTCAGEYGLP
eukprot:Amastigsp_a677727_47.p2 type:complete len:132 gc:universal Amastigsp_a677727_47:245-640(+)